ncbi:hypothetical protein GCM10022409_49410 [Hymenobacter glaciei]|uniref:Knr4/Smi1-like domain-containing protein n=1 Tax=Hymenobacter glaciei TaxID=877209 RepID=A0ABP7UZL3_9BACT
MHLPEALRLIQTFWQEPVWPFQPAPTAETELARLRQEFREPLPPALEEYLRQAAPAEAVMLATVGNPFDVYSLAQMGRFQDGYTFNSVTQQPLNDWPAHWFMFANEGGDPVIVDLQAANGAVIQLRHGAGNWETSAAIAGSIGQFLLCGAALQHALHELGGDDPIIDDENGFQLVPEAAAWLFPHMREWAGPYYEEWCSAFDNS